MGCSSIPEILVWSLTDELFVSYQSLNLAFMETEFAPILQSSAILSQYLGKSYGQYKKALKESTEGEDQATLELPVSVKWFKTAQMNHVMVGAHEQGVDYVDILVANGTDTQSLKKKQRIRVGKGKAIGVGKLKDGRSVLSVSSNEVKETKIFTKNAKTGEYEFYQKLNRGATSLKLENVNDKSYLSYASPTEGFGFCEWQGASGYGDCRDIEITDTTYVETVVTSQGVFTLAVMENRLTIYKTIMEGNNLEYNNQIC